MSLAALAALPVHAARHGAGATVVAAAGAVLLWVIGLVFSAVALELVGGSGGPVGAVLTGVLTGTVMGVLGSAWAVAPWAGLLLVTGPPAGVEAVLRWTPGAWPLDGTPVLLLPLLALVGAGFLAYTSLVRRILDGAGRAPVSRTTTAPARFARNPVGAVIGRERQTWRRHPLRLQYLAFALVYGVLLAGLPLLADVSLLAPWAGVLVVLWAAAMAASLVGLDGTALWLPLTTPGGERAEVLGRSLAWLAIAAPAGIVLTLGGMLVAPSVDPVAALAVLPAALGAGAGAPVWISLLRVRAVDDPRRPTAADNPTDIVSVLLVMGAVAVTAAPSFSLVVWGPGWARWPALAVGVLCGAAAWWGAARAAVRRLSLRGAEVIASAGHTAAGPSVAIPLAWDGAWVRSHPVTVWSLALLTVGWIPVVPQGLMVLVLDISGGWIVASHLEGAARTATALAMVTLGATLLITGLILWDRREPETA